MTQNSRNGRTAFRYPDYRNYVASRFLWNFGLQVMSVATSWLVYERTGDPLSLGLIGLASFLPMIPLSLITGPAADRHDRRRILIGSCALMAFCASAMLTLTYVSLVWPIYAVVVVLASARSFSNPAGQALMMSLVPDAEFTSAVSWNNSVTQLATILGPAVGGLLYPLGPVVPFSVALVFFVLGIVLSARIKAQGRPTGRPPVTLAVLVAGYKYIWSRSILLGTITLDLAAVLLGGCVSLLPIFASEIFHEGPWALGVLRSAPSVGSVIAAIVTAHVALNRRVGAVMFACVFVFGLATVGFGLSTNIYLAAAFLIALGAADMVSVVIRQTLIQVETPNEMRGRVIAVHTILTGTSNQLGDFESGLLAHFVGAVNAVLIGGAGSLVATTLWMKLFPGILMRDKFEKPKEEAA